jgi:hypothetical protein
MVWFYIAIAVGVFVAIAVFMSIYGTPESGSIFKRILSDAGAAVGVGLVTTIVCGLLEMMINIPVFYLVDEDYQTYSVLSSLNDGTQTNGSFFLGSGYIDSRPVYRYYVENGRGEFRLQSAPADRAFITYTDSTPEVVYHQKRSSSTFWSIGIDGDGIQEYEFRVPKGSVKTDFTLDAK